RLAEFAGWYSLSAATRQEIRRDGDHLVAERAGRAPQVLLPESGDVFFTPGRPRTRRIFTRDADGRVSGFADRREGTDLAWTRVEAPGPAHCRTRLPRLTRGADGRPGRTRAASYGRRRARSQPARARPRWPATTPPGRARAYAVPPDS